MTEESESPPPGAPASPFELFVVFTLLALQGFGGVLAVAQRVICEQRRWLTRAQFIELLSLGQVLPGPNVCNLALLFGDRAFGLRGALAALGGLLTVPLALVLAVSAVYVRWAGHPAVAGALRGMGAVSAGLIVGTALKLARSLGRNPMGRPACLGLGVATFALVGVLSLPLAKVVLAVGSIACLFAWWRLGSASGSGERP